jgi:HemY protein
MKFGLIVIVALVLSAFAAHTLLQDPGYVVISFHGYLVEMSVPVLIGVVLALIAAIWLVVKLLKAPRKLGEAAARYRSGRAGQRLTRGMIEVAEGNFAKGERLLARTAHKSDAPLLNYLQAARAAHLLGQDERRDNWLRHAYEQTPEAANAVLLTQAELQLDQKQYEQALATLRKLSENAPNHGRALALIGSLYYRLEDWGQLADLIPRLRKYGRMDSTVLDSWSEKVHCENLIAAADGNTIDIVWQAIPRGERKRPTVRETWYLSLLRTGMDDKAEKEIAQDLKRQWNSNLSSLYGLAESSDNARQLKRAEGWLRQHGDDTNLLLAAARLCLRAELWGKARSYLETVISLRPTPEAYQEYGRLLNQMGDSESAADAYRDGLGMVSDSNLSAVPRLTAEKSNTDSVAKITDESS